MISKDEIKELRKETGWLLAHRINIAENRTVGEQFYRTKKFSDFVGFLTRLMFLAAIQAFITEASKTASIPYQFIYAFVGAVLLLVQLYFSYAISAIVTKTVLKVIPKLLDIDMSFQLGRNKPTVIFFIVLALLQVLYFGMNSTLRDVVSRSTATISENSSDKQ